jgi:peptidoglycan/xylan/chitin deacetylase (PgdA/CDA1 family)
MFLHADIKAADLPTKTLVLTYDDGPGQQTTELGRYLGSEKIPATFFVIGQHAENQIHTLLSLSRAGHTIGNHTFSHPGLVTWAETGGDVVGEIARTDDIIREFAGNSPIFFRAPYGNWRQIDPSTQADMPHSIVAQQLNRSGRFCSYIGPVNWDVSAEDFAFWRREASPEEAAEAYLREIQAKGRGIVLMHDSSDDPAIARRNRTLELTMLLVPQLKRGGYLFVPLHAVPHVKRLLNTRSRGKRHVVAPGPHHGRNDHPQSQGRDASLAR